VSDAGTPLISDPGYRLIDAALEAGIAVVPIPGPCAAIAALSASGLPTDAFYFGGFLPPKATQRRKLLESLRSLEATLIFYEAPHRIVECVEDIEAALGNRNIVLAREITKMYEEFLRGTAGELSATLKTRDSIKGEFTVLIGKATEAANLDSRPVEEAVAELESQGMPRMEAIKTVARDRGLPKREIYRLISSRQA
jgi:16S rRNA (cytidine1402-2'-O)-methyltransferase